MPLFLAPICNDQTFDANGDPLVGGQIETYIADSSTPAATYTDDTGVTPQSNPIILNSLGRPTLGPIWLTGGVSYKFIIKNAAGSTLWTIDNISGVNDASVSQSEWVESGLVATYISATSFSVPGDQTAILQIGRRLRTTNTSGLVTSTISNSAFAAGITTVTLTNDSTALDAGLSLIAYALLAASPLSVPDLPGSKITGSIAASGMTMTTDRILGRVSASTGAIEELTRTQLSVLSTSKLQPLSASVASNALTITLSPTTLDFRNSSSLGNGSVTTLSVPTAINLVISSGSTLGSTNGVLTRLAVLAINNAGTVELAVSNLAGAVNIAEGGLISTTAEGGAGGADSATVIYSPSSQAFVPFRIIGFIEYTQATAGTYATAPSWVDGNGEAAAKWLAGYGQTSQGLTGSRALNTTYTNSTGRTIDVNVSAIGSSSADIYIQLLIDGSQRARSSVSYQEAGVWRFLYNTLSFKVPPGSTYRVDVVGGTATLTLWSEER